MATLSLEFTASSNLYVVFRNTTDQLWEKVSSAFENYSAGDWTTTGYCHNMSAAQNARHYQLTVPSLPAGIIKATAYLRAGGSPATTDVEAHEWIFTWDGTDFVGSVTTTTIVSALGGVADIHVVSGYNGSALDLYAGDTYANGDSRGIAVTETSADVLWPTTLSTVHFWAWPTARLLIENSSALAPEAERAVSTLTSSGTTATCTTSAAHGYSTNDIVAIYGSTLPEYNGYYQITVTGATTFTYTLAAAASASPATGTIKVQRGIACTVTQATGSAQAFRFEPTSAQLRRCARVTHHGYEYAFVANVGTNPAVLRSGPFKPLPTPVAR